MPPGIPHQAGVKPKRSRLITSPTVSERSNHVGTLDDQQRIYDVSGPIACSDKRSLIRTDKGNRAVQTQEWLKLKGLSSLWEPIPPPPWNRSCGDPVPTDGQPLEMLCWLLLWREMEYLFPLVLIRIVCSPHKIAVVMTGILQALVPATQSNIGSTFLWSIYDDLRRDLDDLELVGTRESYFLPMSEQGSICIRWWRAVLSEGLLSHNIGHCPP